MKIFFNRNRNSRSDEEVAYRYRVGKTAYDAEMKRALRDPRVWTEQTLSVMGALIKGACLAVWLEVVLRYSVPGIMDGVGQPWPGILALALSPMVLFLVVLNPRQAFWRMVFLDRSYAAFKKALDDLDGYSK